MACFTVNKRSLCDITIKYLVLMLALKNVYLYRTVSVLRSKFSELLSVGVA